MGIFWGKNPPCKLALAGGGDCIKDDSSLKCAAFLKNAEARS